jgi:flavin reductase (DIM6/NTAB) family NADH-FMN oxidoreductase RutF
MLMVGTKEPNLGSTTLPNGPASSRLPSPDEALEAYFDRIDYPYFVVTVRTADGEMSGCLAGFVTQCSIDPPNFLVCIAKVNHTFDVAGRSDAMGLHLLGEDQHELARIFGEETGDLVDKFAQCDWRLGPTGAPLLVESAVSMEGRILGHFSAGDHEAFLVRAERAVRGHHEGLLTYRDAPNFRPGHPL